jgi:hypothetical protein
MQNIETILRNSVVDGPHFKSVRVKACEEIF